MKTTAVLLCIFALFPAICHAQITETQLPETQPRRAQEGEMQAPVPDPFRPEESGSVTENVSGRRLNLDPSSVRPLFPGPFYAIDALDGFHVSLALQEEYNSNLFLTETDRRDDFITTVAPGLQYRKVTPQAGIDMKYSPGYNKYASESDLDYVSHFGLLNSYYGLSQNLTFRLRDYLLRSDEPREYDPFGELNQYYISTDSVRSPHLRNIVEPELNYRFGQNNSLSLLYRNMYYDNDSPTVSDGTENTAGTNFRYWFNIRNGIVLDYYYIVQKEDLDQDSTGHAARARYIYRFNSRTSVFGEMFFEDRSFDPPDIGDLEPEVDYRVYSPSIGISHSFSPSLSGSLQVGYYTKDPESGSSEESLLVNALLSKRTVSSVFNLVLIGGFREEYLTAESLGFIEYKRAEFNMDHRLLSTLRGFMAAHVERADYSNDRRDWIYGALAGLSWQPLRWLRITPFVSYRSQDSNAAEMDYDEFRGMVRVSFVY